MSRRGLKLKVDQTLVEASFKLENISEDMKNELKTSAKEFILKDEDGKKVTASKIDKDDLPILFNKNNNVESATDDFGKVEDNDLDKAKSDLSQYFSDSFQYSYDETDNVKPTGDEVPKVAGSV